MQAIEGDGTDSAEVFADDIEDFFGRFAGDFDAAEKSLALWQVTMFPVRLYLRPDMLGGCWFGEIHDVTQEKARRWRVAESI
ncbi:hypothetical protein [Halomicronema sp. CCY15110]|uniref:hypothetical protein n=1 Tax=Halomicronema sp. CCY15110 TaxID=2767773 RepID=UPI001951BBA2|nr:hypothetical protein [Halomicronema sp. CCY15110]